MDEYDYQVSDSNGEIHNYYWDDEQKKMVEGKRQSEIPWFRLHQIAAALNGTVALKNIVHSNGKRTKEIVIEFTDEV